MAYNWRDDIPKDGFGFREGEDVMGFTAEERQLTVKAHTRDEFEVLIRARDERRLKEHQERERQAWPATRAGQLLKKLGECFAEYKECLEQDPRLHEKAYARAAGRGEAGEDQLAEPGRCERDPWSDCQRGAGGGGRKAGLQAGVNTGVLSATGIEQCWPREFRGGAYQ